MKYILDYYVNRRCGSATMLYSEYRCEIYALVSVGICEKKNAFTLYCESSYLGREHFIRNYQNICM